MGDSLRGELSIGDRGVLESGFVGEKFEFWFLEKRSLVLVVVDVVWSSEHTCEYKLSMIF